MLQQFWLVYARMMDQLLVVVKTYDCGGFWLIKAITCWWTISVSLNQGVIFSNKSLLQRQPRFRMLQKITRGWDTPIVLINYGVSNSFCSYPRRFQTIPKNKICLIFCIFGAIIIVHFVMSQHWVSHKIFVWGTLYKKYIDQYMNPQICLPPKIELNHSHCNLNLDESLPHQ